MKTIVVQNQGNHAGRPGTRGDWEHHCTQSVQRWAEKMEYDYKRTSFDESFDWYPSVWAKGLNQILALHQPDYDRVIMLENDTYIFGDPDLPDGDFIMRESFMMNNRIHCRDSTTLIAAKTVWADRLVAWVLRQADESTRDVRVQLLIEDEKQPRISDEELTRIWASDNRQMIHLIPATRRDSSSCFGNNFVDWTYPDQFIHLGKPEKQFQWVQQCNLMLSDDPIELQRTWLYAQWNGWLGEPDAHGRARWDAWVGSEKQLSQIDSITSIRDESEKIFQALRATLRNDG
mgnify:CR=1 FL=1